MKDPFGPGKKKSAQQRRPKNNQGLTAQEQIREWKSSQRKEMPEVKGILDG